VRLAVLATLAVLAAPAAGAAAAPPALAAAADALADALGAPADGRRGLALSVEVHAPALAAPLEAALEAALARRGYSVTPSRGPEREAAAREAGQDWLLRVQGGLVPGRRELALVGELIPAWASFFLQKRAAARAIPPRLVQARAAADAETLALARAGRPAGAPFATTRTLARLPGRVIGLAAGEVEPGTPGIVAALEDGVLLLSAAGALVARRDADAAVRRPVRDPAAALAVGDLGGGRIAALFAGAAEGEVLERHGDGLVPVASLGAAPLCAAEGLRVFGAFAPGKGLLADLLTTAIDPEAQPRSGRELYGVACAPRGGPIAVAVLGTDLRLELLDGALKAVTGRAPGSLVTGSAFTLADLDGDGTAELVATSAAPAGPDRIRILAPLAPAPLLLESSPVAGLLLAAAAADLTGDGVDDAVLASIAPGEDGAPVTELLLVTADPREAP
jgi:hypothetical protein